MKNNKGFTLIELLAVMVILAIIALIAVPVVMSVINNARKAAAVDSVYGIVKAAEAYYANELLNNGTFNSQFVPCDLLEYKGTKITGAVYIKDNGLVTIQDPVKINGFDCEYDGTKATCS